MTRRLLSTALIAALASAAALAAGAPGSDAKAPTAAPATKAPATQSPTTQPPTTNASANSRATADILKESKPSEWRSLDPENTLYVEIPSGRVVIELAPAFTPLHADNIRALVRGHYFDGLAILRAQDNYVVQWGDPEEDEAKARSLGKAKATLAPEFTAPIKASEPFTRLPDKDGYAPEVGFSDDFPVGRDPASGQAWLTHCYGAVGVARGNAPDSGNGSGLYVIISHAPRHLDRNIAVVGRVVQGMEKLSVMPRGTGPLGFYEDPAQRTTISAIRLAADVPAAERTNLEVLRGDSPSFAAVAEARRNRHDDWYIAPAKYIELCNVPIPVRPVAGTASK
jgi:peptidylprolyl isomerase